MFAWHDGVAIAERKLEQPIVIDGTVMFATPLEAHNWAVWLFHALPAIAHFQRNRHRYAKLFIHAEHPSMRETLAMLGVGEADMIQHDLARTYLFREVDLLRHQELQFFVHPFERMIFGQLVAQAEATENAPPSRRIYVSRRSRGDYRRLINEDELIGALAGLGFAAVDPQLLPAAAQVHGFAGAEAVVGLGGAGMFNTVFCRQGTKVLDIESSSRFALAHAGLFASAGLDYGMIVGEQDATDPQPTHKRWRLDVATAMPHIARFFGQ
jgi:capsular polysaccharide biosynthesis protein